MYGLGCTKKQDAEWVAGQDDFNAVLKMLNSNDTSDYQKVKQEKKRAIEKRKLSSRFVKAKNLGSTASKADLAALFGTAIRVFLKKSKPKLQKRKNLRIPNL